MVEPAETRRLQGMLRAAVQSVRWTYSLFWQLCPQQGILVWGDGYYNGVIKTRKTIQHVEVTTEEATQHRSRQLRELYDSLISGEAGNQAAQRPAASLSPEDLTESEWFYLLCVSFSFPPGAGLPGKAYAKRRHTWLARANEVDNKIFSRSILAKSARIQTVLCIPLLDGVVELGTTERVEEDVGLVQRVKTFFHYDGRNPNNNPPRPALSEQSTSNNRPTYPVPRFSSPAAMPMFPSLDDCHVADHLLGSEDDNDDEEEVRLNHQNTHEFDHEAVQLDGDIPLESPDGGSNNLNSDFDLQQGNNIRAHSKLDTHYSQTVSAILQSQSAPRSNYTSSTFVSSCTDASSAFSKWPCSGHSIQNTAHSQRALKFVLLTVPLLQAAESPCRGHVLAERRRREKLNEQFSALSNLVPFVTKMDKASILGDAIVYLKQLRKRIQELEGRKARAAVEVSIIDRDALVEIECLVEKDGLLQGLMQALGDTGMEVTTVQSSICNGVFVAEFRAKVKDNGSSRKTKIMEVKRSINQIIPHF